jgi:hypothetical protein
LRLDEAPDFVNLQIPGAQVAHGRIHETGAALTGKQEQPHDRVPIHASEPLRRTDRAEAVALESRCRSAFRVLQLLPSAFQFASHTRHGSRTDKPCLDALRVAFRFGRIIRLGFGGASP